MNVIQWFNLKSFGGYLGGNLLFQLVSFAAEFAVLKMVDIEEMGLWQMALLFQGYVVISRLGIVNAYNLEYPMAIAQKDKVLATQISETMNAHILFTIVFQALGFFIAGSYFYLVNDNSQLANIFFCMILYTVIEALTNYEEAKKRAELNFESIGKIKGFSSVFIILSLLLPYFFGLIGLIIRAISNQIIFLIYYKIIDPSTKYNRNYSFTRWLKLFKTGWKLWLWSYLKSFGKSIPRLFVVTFLSIQALGLFTPIQWMSTLFVLFTSSVSSYLYPKLTYLVNKKNNQVTRTAFIVTLGTIIILIPVAVLGHFTIPIIFNTLLPSYASVIPATQIVIWASLLELFSMVASSWVSQRKWKFMFVYVIGALIFRIGGMSFPYFISEPQLIDVSKGILISSTLITFLIVILISYERILISNQQYKNENIF